MKVAGMSKSKKGFISLSSMDIKSEKKQISSNHNLFGIHKYYVENAESVRTHCAILTSNSC